MSRKYGIIGTGAIGGFFAVKLHQAGFDVHCLLQSDYSQVQEGGLRLISDEGGITQPVHAYHDIHDMPPCDVVLVALKTTANSMLERSLSHLLKNNTKIVVLQNGIGIEEELARFIEPESIIGGSCSIKVTKIAPGVIRHDGANLVELASYVNTESQTKVLDQLAHDFNAAGIIAKISTHLPTMRWMKLIHNMPLSGLSVIYHASTQAVIKDHYVEVLALTKEIIAAARQCGAILPHDYLETRLKYLDSARDMPATYSSMKVDYDNKKPLELAAIYENPLAMAAKHNITMPLTTALYLKLAKMNRENIEALDIKPIHKPKSSSTALLIKSQQQDGLLNSPSTPCATNIHNTVFLRYFC